MNFWTKISYKNSLEVLLHWKSFVGFVRFIIGKIIWDFQNFDCFKKHTHKVTTSIKLRSYSGVSVVVLMLINNTWRWRELYTCRNVVLCFKQRKRWKSPTVLPIKLYILSTEQAQWTVCLKVYEDTVFMTPIRNNTLMYFDVQYIDVLSKL